MLPLKVKMAGMRSLCRNCKAFFHHFTPTYRTSSLSKPVVVWFIVTHVSFVHRIPFQNIFHFAPLLWMWSVTFCMFVQGFKMGVILFKSSNESSLNALISDCPVVRKKNDLPLKTHLQSCLLQRVGNLRKAIVLLATVRNQGKSLYCIWLWSH